MSDPLWCGLPLKLLTLSTVVPLIHSGVYILGCCAFLKSTIISLVFVTFMKRLSSWHRYLQVGLLIIVRDQAHHDCVIRKLNGAGPGHVIMCVQGVQYWAEDATLGDPVFRKRGLEVCLPTLTTWGLAVRKSRIQPHRGVFSPSSISLSASLVGTMVLKAEL